MTVLASCKKSGCTDISAINYDAEANKDDNSCLYEANLSVRFHLKNGNIPFSIYDTLSFENNEFRLEKLKFYVSNVRIDNDSTDSYVKDVHLVDMDNVTSQSFTLVKPEGSYSRLSFGVGLDDIQNNTTPANYSVDHPLGLNQNTFWAMTPSSYIFIMLEGKMDTSSTTDFYPMSYHLAHSDLYQILNFDKTIVVDANQSEVININLNMAVLFNNVDLSEDLPHQSKASPLAIQLMSNFCNALEIE